MNDERSEQEKQIHQYDLFAEKFRELYLEEKTRTVDGMHLALERAREYLTGIGELSAQQGELFKHYLTRDLDQTMREMARIGREASAKMHLGGLGAGALASLVSAMEFTKELLDSALRRTTEAITYRTGEITSAGSLTCQGCGQKMQLKKTGHIPPCPKCAHTVFHKSF